MMTNGIGTGARRGINPILVLLFWLANLAFLVRFADRDGYEGDDLNSILPMAHLDAAKHGLLLIYRYGWQPLSYETGAALWRWFGTPDAVFLSAPVAGACALALLFWWLWREGRSSAPLATALVALLAAPELWYSALYFNSTILGMPLLAAALLLVRSGDSVVRGLIAGVLVGLAILMRMDFILVCPLLAMAAWPRGKGLAQPIAVAAGVVAVLLGALAIGLLDLPEVMRIQAMSTAEIRDKAHLPGWDLRMKISVLSVSLSPAGWLMILVGVPLILSKAGRNRDWRTLLWIAAAVPAVYPLTSMLSPKYLLPLLPFLLLLFVKVQTCALAWFGAHWRGYVQSGLIAVVIAQIFVSISLVGHAPFLFPGLAPIRPVDTHDGPRAYGGYLWQMMGTDTPDKQSAKQLAARPIERQLFARPPKQILYLGSENYFDPGAVGWRHVQLALEKRHVHGALVAPHVLLFDLGNGRHFMLAREMPAAQPNGYEIIDARGPSVSGD